MTSLPKQNCTLPSHLKVGGVSRKRQIMIVRCCTKRSRRYSVITTPHYKTESILPSAIKPQVKAPKTVPSHVAIGMSLPHPHTGVTILPSSKAIGRAIGMKTLGATIGKQTSGTTVNKEAIARDETKENTKRTDIIRTGSNGPSVIRHVSPNKKCVRHRCCSLRTTTKPLATFLGSELGENYSHGIKHPHYEV